METQLNRVDSIFESVPSPARFAQDYGNYLAQLLQELDYQAIQKVIECFLAARERGNSIFFVGNGGSAATASHFANDLAIGTRGAHKPFRAVSLTDNVAILTAIGNDSGYDLIFVQQLQALFNKGDVVVAISASGNSPSVVKAVEYANRHGGTSVAISGFDGGEITRISNLALHVRTPKGEYGPVEDLHLILNHMIGNYLMRTVRCNA